MKSKFVVLQGVLGRRAFLTGGAALGATAAARLIASAAADTYGGEVPWQAGETNAPRVAAPGFLSPAEREFLDAAVARLIPTDDLGAGAREAGCTEFIDRQLAGPYGRAETLYMQGPWQEGTETQGFQSRLTPARSYRIGIAAVEEYCRSSYASKSFRDLVPAEQDALLTGLETGAIELSGINAKEFFEMLLQNTLEGFWSDPIYGGNRDFVGWNLIGFPGARYDYGDHIARAGERYPLPPVGLRGRKDWSSRG
jgi:gluconate 2-dehydrogenase gamma chain